MSHPLLLTACTSPQIRSLSSPWAPNHGRVVEDQAQPPTETTRLLVLSPENARRVLRPWFREWLQLRRAINERIERQGIVATSTVSWDATSRNDTPNVSGSQDSLCVDLLELSNVVTDEMRRIETYIADVPSARNIMPSKREDEPINIADPWHSSRLAHNQVEALDLHHQPTFD